MKADKEYLLYKLKDVIRNDIRDDIELYIEQSRIHALRFAHRHKEFSLEEIIELYRKQTPQKM